ncbi:MAG: FtsX-like permease family protein, partial [Bacteroidota bacterium]
KYKWYASLNLLGLAIGFAAFILISIYLHHQTNYESFHSKADRIYRASYLYTNGTDFTQHFARTPLNYINELPNQIPEIEKLIRFQNNDKKTIRIGQDKFKPKFAWVADAEVFEVFDFELLEGDPSTALSAPNSIVLTESKAQQYFGKTSVIGEEIFITTGMSPDEQNYKVTGIMADLPSNTHLPVDVFYSFPSEADRRGWAYVYCLLSEGSDIAQVESKKRDFILANVDEEQVNFNGISFQHLPAIHLGSNLAREIKPNGNATYIKIFYFVAFIILIIAFINFINLNSALSMGRSKEMGVRKVLGASKTHHLIYAFTESISYKLIGLIMGIAIAFFIYPRFRELTGVEWTLPLLPFSLFLLLITFIGGLLSGIYPATILNSLQLNTALKSTKKLRFSNYSINVKNLLVGLQFSTAIILIAGALVAYQQLNYLHKKDLGFSTEQIIAIPSVPDAVTARYSTFKERLKSISGVTQVAACMQVPSEEIRDSGPARLEGQEDMDMEEAPMLDMQVIDNDFLDIMGVEIIAGNPPINEFVPRPIPEFSAEYTFFQYIAEQKRSYLINETAMQQLGFNNPEEAIGQNVSWNIGGLEFAMGPISAVVKDFHQETLKNKIDPLLLMFEPLFMRTFLLKVDPNQLNTILPDLNEAWTSAFPKQALEYHFLDDMFEQLYKQEQVEIKLLSWFSMLSIFIAAMGLFSLVAFSLRTRVKEIAIRQVLGAKLPSLVKMISRNYLWMIIISGIIAIPLSYYGANIWLENFAYR